MDLRWMRPRMALNVEAKRCTISVRGSTGNTATNGHAQRAKSGWVALRLKMEADQPVRVPTGRWRECGALLQRPLPLTLGWAGWEPQM